MTIRERIDNTVFEHLRRQVVLAGYLPNAVDYIGDNTSWLAARAALLTTLGQNEQLIDIFGYGTPADRMEKAMSRITVDRAGQQSGDIGSYGVIGYEKYEESGQDRFKRLRYPSGTYDLTYEVRVISDRQKYESLMEDIITSVYGTRRYIKLIDDTGNPVGEPMLIEFQGQVNLSQGKTNEKMFRFICKDIWLDSFIVEESGIVPLTSVEISYYLKTDTSGDANVVQTINFTP